MHDPSANASAREQYEAAFHDARIDAPDERRMGYAYASVKDVYAFSNVPPDCLDGSVLELGCFRGQRARRLNGGFHGRFIGIDISAAAVEHCRALGLPSNFDFRVDNANELATIPDESVDYAFGDGVLHHLDLARLGPALARKLSPGGYARFIEPAQGNFLLRAFRKLTPKLRTPDEHPFDQASIEMLERSFHVHITHHALLRPFAPMLLFNSELVTKAARWLDTSLLRYRPFQQQAWLLQIEMRRR